MKGISNKNLAYSLSKIHTKEDANKQLLNGLQPRLHIVQQKIKVDLNDNTLCGSEALVRWQKNEKFIPPNEFIPILESEKSICKLDFYILKTEITNLDYITFLNTIKNTPDYQKALPDTTVWSRNGNINNGYQNQYFRYPGFRMYPVVGVSFEGANLYCKWLQN